jgi:ribosome-associated protein
MQIETLIKEFNFKAIRSGGPGGQHVNKTATKIELSFNIITSKGLTDSEKERLKQKLGSRISSEGSITLQSSGTRSQFRNKAIAIERMLELLKLNVRVAKPRKKTKPSKSAIERRLKAKKTQALKKSYRRTPGID